MELTPVLYEQAVQLAREGLSAPEIAQKTGLDRKQILNKFYKEGIKTRGTARGAAVKINSCYHPPKDEFSSEAVLSLKPRHCRWPEGDPGTPEFRFCAADRWRDNGSYCEHHHKLAYTNARQVTLSDEGRAAIRAAQLKRHHAAAKSGLSLSERMRAPSVGA